MAMANRALPLHFTISNFDHSRTQKPLHFPCIVSTITKRTHLAEMFQDQRIDHLKRIVSRSRTLYQSVAGYVPTSDGLDRSLLGFDCDEVYPSLFIGDRRAATNRNYIEHLGVTHILNVAETPNCFRFQNALFYQDMRVSYMGISLEDNVDSQISQYFHVTANFIDTAIKNGGNVLVNCVRGLSRSGTIAASYLMIKCGMTAPLALTIICQSRRILPNDGFLEQLALLDNLLQQD